jgi:8-oxo-dGTP diphosphatase
MAEKERVIPAAGTVVFRRSTDAEPEVLLVHRQRYDDWSLPKGKLDPGEYLACCAVRETWEETGVRVRLAMPLNQVSYEVGQGSKVVSFWRAEVIADEGFKPCDEVDRIRWLPVSKALLKASYPEDPILIKQAVDMPATTPFIILRHGKAVGRDDWPGPDPARPLADRGQRQGRHLIPLLEGYGISRLASSTSTRCIQTLEPYARSKGLSIQGWAALSEEDAELRPAQVTELMAELLHGTAVSTTPMVVCGHRPVMRLMLEAASVSLRPLRTSAAIVCHLSPDGETVAMEHHRPLF